MAAQQIEAITVLGQFYCNENGTRWATELGESIARRMCIRSDADRTKVVRRNHYAIREQIRENLSAAYSYDTIEDLIGEEPDNNYAIILISVFVFLEHWGFQNAAPNQMLQILRLQLEFECAELKIWTGYLETHIPRITSRRILKPHIERLIEQEVKVVTPLNVLCFFSCPNDYTALELDEEYKEIESALQKSRFGDELQVSRVQDCQIRDITQELARYSPDILHFSGHGYKDGLVFQDEYGYSDFMEAERFAQILSTVPKLKLVILNACNSDSQAWRIANRIGLAIGMIGEVYDTNSVEFSREFYGALGHGLGFSEAFQRAQGAMLAHPTMSAKLFENKYITHNFRPDTGRAW